MIYIVRSSDQRFLHLTNFLKSDNECEYSNKMPVKNNIKILVLPMEGIDEFGFIKHTSINLEKFISLNKLEKIYTGKVNNVLFRICQLNNIKLYSFFEDENYLKGEEILKMDVIKIFLEEKLNTKFSDLNVMILNNDNINQIRNLLIDKLFSIFKIIDNKNIDAVINFSDKNLTFFKDKIIIEMNEISNVDLSILLNCKKIFFINQLLSQYLTKSGGRLLYDSMVKR